jgi:Zn-dependent peptidase ImmA (M78 family)/transcriptional regulator with XRE-family HTH domain
MCSAVVPKQKHMFDRRMFNPTRFSCARKRKGLSKSQMALLIGVELRSVSAYEAGDTIPGDEIAERIVSKTGFSPEFFSGDDLEELSLDAVSFRSMSKMSSRQRDMATSQGAFAIHLCRYIEEKFELPQADIPDLSHEPTPEAASDTLRRHWGIGVLPVSNMIHLLESKGVRVFSLAIDAREVDAFSTWKAETPMVFLNTFKTAEHSRYDAAHELGHLVLHRHATPNGREAEREADLFASAFLMPKASVIAQGMRSPSFSDLVQLKSIWKVSVAALNRRLHDVGMTTDWHYRMTCIELGKHDRTKEPNEIPRETSQVLPKVFSKLYEEKVSRSDVAHSLSIPRAELEQLMFGLTITSIDGGGKGSSQAGRAQLRLVEAK